jgi:large repetitive protein
MLTRRPIKARRSSRRPTFDALEIRLTPSVDIVASVDGYATGPTNGQPFQYTTLNSNDYQVYTDYLRTVGLIEFDLSGIAPGTVITSATLKGTMWSAQYNNLDGYAAANFYGYRGDGQLTLSDATAPDVLGSGTPIATFTNVTSTSRALSSSVRTDFLQSIIDTAGAPHFAGLHMRLAHAEELGMASTEAAQYATPPTLHLDFAGNSPPSAANDAYSTAEDTPLIVAAPGVLANDSDPDADPLTALRGTGPSHGTLALNADGSFTYTPSANYNGPDSFSYRASDGANLSTLATVSLTVTPVDDAPVARDDAYLVKQGSTFTANTPGDSGGELLRYGFDEAGSGAAPAADSGAAPAANGNFQGAATRGATGPNGVGGGVLDLTGGNGYVSTGADVQKLDSPTALTLTAWINLQAVPNDGDLIMSDAPPSFPTPPAGSGGWLFQINTPWNNSNPLSASNFALAFGVRQSQGSSSTTSYSTSYALSADHQWAFVAMTIDATGLQTFYSGDATTPLAQLGGQFIQNTPILDNAVPFQVGGTGLESADHTAPAWLDDVRVYNRALSRDELARVQGETTRAGVLANDFDPEGDPFSARLVAAPQHGALTLNANGSFTYTPDPAFTGDDSFTYQAVEGQLASPPATVILTVASFNSPPVASNDNFTTNEDVTLTIGAPGVLGNDSDPDGNSLSAVLVSGPSHGALTLNADGSFIYTPAANYNGPDAFTYKPNDGQANGNVATVSITVTPVNDAPVAHDDSYAVDEDGNLVVPQASGAILRYNFDEASTGAAAALDSGASPAANGAFFGAATRGGGTPGGASRGALDLTGGGATTNYVGPGADADKIDAMPALTVTMWINLRANPNDDDVLISDDPAFPSGANTGGWNLRIHDALGRPNTAASLTLFSQFDEQTTSSSGQGQGITWPSLNADKRWVFVAMTYSANHVVSTYSGDEQAAVALLSFANFNIPLLDNATALRIGGSTIDPTNDHTPPAWIDDVRIYNQALSSTDLDGVRLQNLTRGGVLANDADVDGDPLSAALVTGPQHGAVTLNGDGTFAYTPAPNYNGADSFTYKANDGAADSNVATVSITVNPVNDAPVAANDHFTVNEDQTLAVAAPGVLANDTDVDGDALKAILIDPPSFGALTLNADGSFTFTPPANVYGTTAFSYKANDGQADSARAFVFITINPVNDRPVATADSYVTNEDAPLTVAAPGVLANDFDIDSPTLTAVLVSGPSHGAVTLNADGSFVYTPVADYYGSDVFTYKANDGQLDSAPTTVAITVNPVNDAPVARNDAYSTNQGSALTIAAPGVLANDSDVDSPILSALVVANPSNGALTLNADGSFTYTPVATFSGVDSFTYKASDGQASSAPATVTITVNPVDKPPIAQTSPVTVTEDGSATITLGGSDDRTPAASLIFKISSLPSRGVVYAGSTPVKIGDAFTGAPALTFKAAVGLDDVGGDGFGYTVTDSANQTTAGVVPITVQKSVADGAATLGADGVLRVGGTAGADNLLFASVKVHGQTTVQVTSGSTILGTFAPAAVKSVRVWGRDGSDQIRINGLSVDALIVGGAGDDTLTGGGGSNFIFGGAGRDNLTGGSVSDFLVGGAGADTVTGAGGDDVLVGGQFARPWTLDDDDAFLSAWDAGGNPQNTTDLSVLDTAIDQLQGNSGRDLFVASQADATDFHQKDKDVLLYKA